ncbi:MAG: DUF222 domain-containing protein [Mycobacteriales bacterium]
MAVTLADLSDDQLADEITTWAGRVAAGEARLIALIGEFDARQAWGGPGLLSCAHWLSWRLGLGLTAARERVRVANRLRDLPLIAAAFGEGRLSWTQVRAITRISDVLVEQDWIRYARSCTGEQLEKLVRGVNRATRPEREAADPELAGWQARPRVRRTDDGLVHLTFVVPEEVSQVVLAGMERVAQQITEERAQRAEDVPAESSPQPMARPAEPQVRDWHCLTDAERAAMRAWYADCEAADRHNREIRDELAAAKAAAQPVTLNHALLRLATAALDAPGVKPPGVRERLRVNVDPISGWARLRNGELLPPGTVTRPEGTFVPGSLTAFDAGRTAREVPLPLRRFLGDVDGERCRFPGCSRVTHLHAHHVRFWAHGGPTDLANLVLVCSRHHTLIHAQGFQLVLSPDRTLTVRTAADIPVPHHPGHPAGDPEALPDVPAGTLPPHLDGRPIDWDWAVYVIAQQAP